MTAVTTMTTLHLKRTTTTFFEMISAAVLLLLLPMFAEVKVAEYLVHFPLVAFA